MDILERIIENLTSDEVRRFKILSNRFKADEEKKLIVLFDAIRAGGYKDIEHEVIAQFYGSTSAKSKNSYYRLRNKLLSNLEKSLLFYHFNYKNSIESYSNIQLSILYRERGLYRESFYSLKKAEKVALEYDQFNVLESIYDEMVNLATHYDVEIEKVIERRKENLKKVEILRANSEILGMITQELTRHNFSRSKRSSTVIQKLESIQQQLEEHQHIFHSSSGRMMILKAVVSILIQKSAYGELESYVAKTFAEFEDHKIFNRDNHSIRLMMRIWRINSLQKLLRLEDAQEEIDSLKAELLLYNKQNFRELGFHYYSASIYNFKLNGDMDAAGEVLKEAFRSREIVKNEVHELYLLISQSDQFFSQELYVQALETIHKIKAHKGFLAVDDELRFYVHIFEIVNLFESRNYKLAESSYKFLRKAFKSFLKDDFYVKAKKFVEILMRMNTAAMEGKSVFIKSAYKNFTSKFPPSEIGDNQIIPYEIYLASRVDENVSYYDLFLAEIKKR